MSNKKKSIGYFASAVVFIVVGVITWTLPEIPGAVGIILNGIGTVLGAFGVKVVLPK